MDKLTFIDEFKALVDTSQSIVITSHKSPDDDSISSVLAVRYWLAKNHPDKKITVVYESLVHPRWQSFDGYQNIEVVEQIQLEDADLLICTDANQFHRFTDQPESLPKSLTKVCIDHHKSQPDSWTLSYIDTQAASTAQIIQSLFYTETDPALAKLILLGILGDTGNLRFIGPEQSNVLVMVKQLVDDAAINIQAFRATYDYYSDESIDVAKDIIAHQRTYQIGEWPSCNISFVERDQFPDIPNEQVKEGVNLYIWTFSMLQQQVSWSLTFYPTDKGVKVSARSLPGSVNVRLLLERLAVGSGHDRAAGGSWTGETLRVEETVKEVLDWLGNNEVVLD